MNIYWRNTKNNRAEKVLIKALKSNIKKLWKENCSKIKNSKWYVKIDILKNNKNLKTPRLNIFKSTSFSMSSLDEIAYRNVGLRNVIIRIIDVLSPKVFLKISVISPKKKAAINSWKTVVFSLCFKIKNVMIIGEKKDE